MSFAHLPTRACAPTVVLITHVDDVNAFLDLFCVGLIVKVIVRMIINFVSVVLQVGQHSCTMIVHGSAETRKVRNDPGKGNHTILGLNFYQHYSMS